MSVQTFSRFGVVLFLAALVSGCSLIGLGGSDAGGDRAGSRGNDYAGECAWNRSSCMQEGSYESGERDYAEQEAKRLNQAALERLRGRSGR